MNIFIKWNVKYYNIFIYDTKKANTSIVNKIQRETEYISDVISIKWNHNTEGESSI